MKRTALLFLIVLSVSLGIAAENPQKAKSRSAPSQPGAESKKPTISKAEEDDIREAVFRYQFSDWASGGRRMEKYYYISLGKDDESSTEFLKRFEGHRPFVRKASQATRERGGVKEGVIFYAGEIKWKGKNEAEVSGSHYKGNRGASGGIYLVVRNEGKWVVTKYSRRWVS